MTTTTNTEGKGWPFGLTILTVVSVVMVVLGVLASLLYAPTEATMGAVQRLFYVHVGTAWAGALAFGVTLAAGVIYLVTRDMRWDRIGYASVEVGLILTTIALVMGMTWGQYAWGTPWTWDPKLTSFAVMWLSYAAYLMLRNGIEDPERRARFAAVYGIVAFAGVVFTYYGVRWIEATIHPYVIGESASNSGDFGMSSRMLQTMFLNLATYTIVFITLTWHRVRLDAFRGQLEALKIRLIQEGA